MTPASVGTESPTASTSASGFAVAALRVAHSVEEVRVDDQRDQPGVVVELGELTGDIAVVDVRGDRAQLERREHRLDVLRPVAHLQPDEVAAAHTVLVQMRGEPVGAVVELRVGEATRRSDHATRSGTAAATCS